MAVTFWRRNCRNFVVGAVLFSFEGSMDTLPDITMLTDRQRQVVKLACRGLSNRAIAEELGVTEGTIKLHLHAIYEQLEVRSRVDLIIRFGTTPWRAAG
jgi:DNA-binding NarL/FixJ family response regulator